MVKADVIYLITEQESAHGVHAPVERTERMVYCQIRSVTRSEFYTALNAGIQPEYVFVLAVAEEYQGERHVRYRDQIFDVVRTYVTEEDGIELTVRRSDDR
jgi:hypothetical protein